MSITITEALAEIKTISKRLEKKRESIFNFVGRQDGIRDPLEKDGGSVEFIIRERQAIRDLEDRVVGLRRGIQRANDVTSVTIGATSRPISDWLVWRRDVAPKQREFYAKFRQVLDQLRSNAKRNGATVITAGQTASQMTDVVINIDEGKLAKEVENLEQVFGELDGQLSLKNATIGIVEE